MPRYRFVKKYRSDRGQWSAGDEVDLTEAEADWFNRDVVDCLELLTPKGEEPEETEPEPEADEADDEGEPDEDVNAEDAEPDDETRAIDAPPSDRQVKRPERTRRRKASDQQDDAETDTDTDETES